MKRILLSVLLITLALSGLAPLRAADAPPPLLSVAPVSVTLDTTYTTKYVWRGQQLAGASLQPSISVTAGTLYASIWSNQPVARHVDNEVDLTAGIAPTVGAYTLDAGVIAYCYPMATSGRHTVEPYLGVARAVAGFSPSVYVYHDYYLHTTTEEVKVGREVSLVNEVAALEPALAGGHVEGQDSTAATYSYWSASVGLPIKVGSHVKLTPSVGYTSHSALTAAETRNLTWASLDLSVSF